MQKLTHLTASATTAHVFSTVFTEFQHLLNVMKWHKNTRMVQLPATAAIEYVAACCRTRTRTRTRTKIGTITKTVRGPYARSPKVQYVYARIRTVWAFCA